MKLEIRGRIYEVEVVDDGTGVHRVTVDGTLYDVGLPEQPARPAPVSRPQESVPSAPAAAAPKKPRAAAAAGSVVAPLPGSVTKIEVKEGDTVTAGQVLVVLESMKMNVPVKSPSDGTVKGIRVKVGDSLQVDEPIMELG
jgi:biotin carboxyl carrier protein